MRPEVRRPACLRPLRLHSIPVVVSPEHSPRVYAAVVRLVTNPTARAARPADACSKEGAQQNFDTLPFFAL